MSDQKTVAYLHTLTIKGREPVSRLSFDRAWPFEDVPGAAGSTSTAELVFRGQAPQQDPKTEALGMVTDAMVRAALGPLPADHEPKDEWAIGFNCAMQFVREEMPAALHAAQQQSTQETDGWSIVIRQSELDDKPGVWATDGNSYVWVSDLSK